MNTREALINRSAKGRGKEPTETPKSWSANALVLNEHPTGQGFAQVLCLSQPEHTSCTQCPFNRSLIKSPCFFFAYVMLLKLQFNLIKHTVLKRSLDPSCQFTNIMLFILKYTTNSLPSVIIEDLTYIIVVKNKKLFHTRNSVERLNNNEITFPKLKL